MREIRFSETKLDNCAGCLKLLNESGKVLLALSETGIKDAVHCGFLDPDNLHYSMFEYLQIISIGQQVGGQFETTHSSVNDKEFLSKLGIKGD